MAEAMPAEYGRARADPVCGHAGGDGRDAGAGAGGCRPRRHRDGDRRARSRTTRRFARGGRPRAGGHRLRDLTHGHPDHVRGASVDGEPAFPNANYLPREAECASWTQDTARAPVGLRAMIVECRRHFLPVRHRLQSYEDDHELAPGITAVAAAGHPPRCGQKAGARLTRTSSTPRSTTYLESSTLSGCLAPTMKSAQRCPPGVASSRAQRMNACSLPGRISRFRASDGSCGWVRLGATCPCRSRARIGRPEEGRIGRRRGLVASDDRLDLLGLLVLVIVA